VTGTAHDRVRRVLAAAGPAGVAPGELPSLAGLDDRASRRAVHRLIEAGLVRRDGRRGRIYATDAAGIAAREGGLAVTDCGPGVPEADNGLRLADLDQALAPLPAPHRALTRLLVCTVIARRHLRQARPSGWLAGIAAGPTGTGKTLIAHAVCQVTGTDPAAAVRLTGAESDRSLWGRRAQQPGGAWALVPAGVLSLPFLVLDELDKCPPALRQAVCRLLYGEARVPAEGTILDVAPVVYATLNGPPAVSVHEAYQRRAVTLDTAPLGLDRAVLARAARTLMAPGYLPRLPVGHLAPPATTLPADMLALMQATLDLCLTPAGQALVNLRGLELAALGYAAAAGTGDLAAAADAALADYLECAFTTGATDSARLDRHASRPPEPAPQTAPADSHADKIAAIGVAGTLRRQAARLTRDLAEAVRDAPAGWQDEAGGVIDQLRELQGELQRARSRAAVEEIGPDTIKALEHAEALASQARARAAAGAARDAAAWTAEAMAAERDRRAQLQAAGQPAAIEGPPAAHHPPPDPYEVLARYRRSTISCGQPPAPAVPGSLFPLQPAWSVPASTQPPRRQQARPPAPAGPPVTAMLLAAAAQRATAPARDTTVMDTLRKLTQQRADAGLPPPTDREIAALYSHP
jgi:MoxR-like ATPase